MSRATLSLLGLYQYDNTIFNELVLPDGMDKQLYINNLLMETAEMEVLFSNPATMRFVIGIWSSAHLDSWAKMWNTTKLEYNPIENYDRMEDWTDNNQTNSKVQSKDVGTGKNHSTDISKAAGFDSGNLVTSGQNDNDSNNESTQIGNSEGNSNEELKHTGRVHGNIGVTTSQQMIEEERRVADWNMYEYLVDKFKQQFLILVY
jgi:hypothetical protein